MTTSGRRLPPVSQAVPKLPVVNEGGVIVDDIAKGDSGCVAIQQLYEDMRSDWSNFRHGEKSAKNGLDRPIQPVCCSFIYICLFIAFVINVAITHTHTQPFYCSLDFVRDGTIRVSRYQKKHSPTRTYRGHQSSNNLIHL